MYQPTQYQLDLAKLVIEYEIYDPLTGVRRCRWCGADAPTKAQKGGEYQCSPQIGCGRWQADKAFPDGIPGLTMDRATCPHCGNNSEFSNRETKDQVAKRQCPYCGKRMILDG